MPLVDLLTDLGNFKYYSGGRGYVSTSNSFGQKSIPYGYDRPGGGNSGQPFVTVSKQNSFGLSIDQLGNIGLNNDLFIRGGVSVAKHVKEDEIRIGKFLASSQGLLWIAQQNLLEKTFKPKLPNDIYPREIYSPLNTLAQLAGNPIGTHINKSGLNPFYFDIPHGQGKNSYGVKTFEDYNEENTNRLTLLYQSKILNRSSSPRIRVSKAFGIKFGDDNFTINTPLVSINRVTNTTLTDSIILNNPVPTSYFTTLTNKSLSENTFPVQYNSAYVSGLEDFRQNVPQDNVKFKSFLAKSNYSTNNRQTTFGMSDPGLQFKDVTDITALSSNQSTDKINTVSLYSSNTVNTDYSESDLIPFYFQVVNNDDPSNYTFVHFRAYIDNFGDSFTGNWQSFKYSGRGENFHIYDSFNRSISLGFTIAIESRLEQQPQYEKISYLASLTAPDYSNSTGFMRGNFVKLTIGDYLTQTPGFINNINYSIANNVPWDIARFENGTLLNDGTQILPMVINVSMTFTPVHNFVPKTGRNFVGNQNKFDKATYVANREAAERFGSKVSNISGTTLKSTPVPIPTSPGQINIPGRAQQPFVLTNTGQRRVSGPLNTTDTRTLNQNLFRRAIPDGLPNA